MRVCMWGKKNALPHMTTYMYHVCYRGCEGEKRWRGEVRSIVWVWVGPCVCVCVWKYCVGLL